MYFIHKFISISADAAEHNLIIKEQTMREDMHLSKKIGITGDET